MGGLSGVSGWEEEERRTFKSPCFSKKGWTMRLPTCGGWVLGGMSATNGWVSGWVGDPQPNQQSLKPRTRQRLVDFSPAPIGRRGRARWTP